MIDDTGMNGDEIRPEEEETGMGDDADTSAEAPAESDTEEEAM